MKAIINGNLKNTVDKGKSNTWIMGHFIDPDSPFHNKDFEIKWHSLKKGESKDILGANTKSKSLSILIRGKFSLKFSEKKEIILDREGDYVYWGPGVSHTWTALEESLVITIRWPSIPNDQYKTASKSL